MKLITGDPDFAWHTIYQYLLAHDGDFLSISGLKYRAIVHESCIIVDEKNGLGYTIDKVEFYTYIENTNALSELIASSSEDFADPQLQKLILYLMGLLHTCGLLEPIPGV